eukprot:CAMPEP_0115011222 /NCGR_PEP_ID=MMETSP0216-20121206/23841_1 /TAXON_ID=223996 /ORGANISM="Protocruzia adherens, Strain Boccale" /LENGTH=140 /DNA_ID=CAMNT_0002379703 /DNA_START=266 /DNA_END=688 /DNA_ORIENTATION=+
MEAALTPIKLSHEVLSAVNNKAQSSGLLQGVNCFGIRQVFLTSPATTDCGSSSWVDDKEDLSTTMSEEDRTPFTTIAKEIKKGSFSSSFCQQKAQKISKKAIKKARFSPQVGLNAFGVRQPVKTFKTRLIVVDGVENSQF